MRTYEYFLRGGWVLGGGDFQGLEGAGLLFPMILYFLIYGLQF